MKLAVGAPIEFRSFDTITREGLRKYADASGDFNQIHLDDDVAKKAGLPGIIAHGRLIAAQVAERAREFVANEASLSGYELVKFQSRFKAMTLLGDTPSVGGTIKEMGDQELLLELQAKNQRGEITTQGLAKFKKSL